MVTTQLVRVKLMAEYLCSPLWAYDDEGRATNVRARDLGIPDELARRVEAWDAVLQATLDRDDPSQSGFASADSLREHRRAGLQLAEEIARALAQRAATLYEPSGRLRADVDEVEFTLVRRRTPFSARPALRKLSG